MAEKPTVTKMQQCQGKPASPAFPSKRRQIFLKALALGGVVTHAAASAGASRKTLYAFRATNPEFAEEWDNALESFADSLEQAARQRGVDGWQEPVYQGGQLVGTVRKYSDSLLLAMLRARKPEYRPAAQVPAPPPAPEKKERDPEKIARKIAFALALAAKNAEQKGGDG
ncbi:hypothetical protein [Candidatus Magnetaquicoccus inordinatus]|uniref:hypothetical protein n=1 Tax=Candidatus Magnetaquicoccus inordinatus TaxID=2496818 RepID=UPI00102BD440|nr:hypothetical protein [Candidatus Magnetaquicoccus inordinatus]